MTLANQRKKEPEAVRQRLLDCAAHILVERGLAELTVQAVAEAAGVTKGGLMHHFPSKQRLIEAVFVELLRGLDAEMDASMAEESTEYGCFTRAYVRSVFHVQSPAGPDAFAALSISMVTDPGLRRAYGEWLRARLARHRDTDGDPSLQLVRYAADGVWLADLLDQDGDPPIDRPALLSQMLDLTRKR